MEFTDFDDGSDNELKWDDAEDSGDDSSVEDDENGVDDDKTNVKRKLKSDEDGQLRKKMRSERKVAPPTAEEMIHLRETETLFKSNLFRMELEELLKEVKPVKTFQNAAKTWIEQLKKLLRKVEEDEDWIHVSETDWLNNINVFLPLPDLDKLFDGSYKFLRPVDVQSVGSFNADCTMGPKFNVDVAVIIPKGFYRKKDNLNQTYHYKRAMYLCAIAGHLKESDLLCEGSQLKFTCLNDDSLKPVLVVNPSGKAANKIEIVIHAIPEENSLQLKRFSPSCNNVRKSWWGCHDMTDELPPTPMYNTSVLEDLVMVSNEKLRKDIFNEFSNMKDAVCLLRVWLRQRSLDQGYGAFSSYLMSMLLIYLKDKQKINKHMSSYQVIRVVWLYLSQSNWCEDGITLCKSESDSEPSLSLFHKHFEVVFVDPSGYLNLTARMNRFTYAKVKSESANAIELLDATEYNGFPGLFMVKMPFMLQYDHIISFSNEDVIQRVSKANSPDKEMDFNGYPFPTFIKLVSDLLVKGLGNRLIELNVKLNEGPRWNVEEPRPSSLSDNVAFGMRLHSDHALNVINKGPQANLPEAAEFREFWGEKSELRRFKDGTVSECTVWEENSPSLSQRLLINRTICCFLLNKIGIQPKDYIYIAHQLDHIIETRIYDIPPEQACLKIHKSLEELSQQLIELDNLPLQITTVHCISPSYRYADVFPPLGCFNHQNPKSFSDVWKVEKGMSFLCDEIPRAPPYFPAIDLVLQMTFTRKWPDDLAACRRLTAAFYLAIANKLLSKHNLQFIPHSDCLLVQKDGLMFRLTLAYSKEISLLKLKMTEDGVKQYRDTPESLELEKKFVNLPNLTGALHGLSVAEPGFGGGVRLVKRWIASHMLDSFHFPPVVAELMVASLFLKPQPFATLLQPQQVFLRFLNMMATTNWHTEMLVVNFNSILSKEEIREAERKFEKERASLPAMVIVTSYDKSGALWTRKIPTLSTTVRLAKLASATLEMLQIQLPNIVPKDNFTSIFVPNLQLYDAVIWLKKSMVPRKCEQVTFKQPLTKMDTSKLRKMFIPVTDFNPPTCYLDYLRKNYGDFALFFYDPYGGCAIGVLFKPSTFESSEFKVNSIGGRCPNYDADPICLKTNFKSLLSDFLETGQDIVEFVRLSDRMERIVNG